MTEFLVRRFVKQHERTEDAAVRTRYGILSSIVGICCNLLLFLTKLTVGLAAGSISVMADAFNNLSDAASSVISFVGVKLAEKPADQDHPFGHGRIEYISAFIVAFLVIQVGFSLFQTSVGKIREPQDMTFSPVSVGILLLSVGVKLWMSLFNRKLGKRIHSSVMLAASADSLGDVGATAATIFSMLVFGIWGVNVDGLVGLLVSAAVMYAGYQIARETLAPLIGQAIDPGLYREITEFVESFDGIVGTHDLIVHNYGPSRNMATIHAEVPGDVSIETSHEIVDRIEREAARKLGIMLVIHMDPVETKNERLKELKALVQDVLSGLDASLTLHDFRMIEGTARVNLIFDLVVPGEYSVQARQELKEQVCRLVRERAPECYCIIEVESGFCAGET